MRTKSFLLIFTSIFIFSAVYENIFAQEYLYVNSFGNFKNATSFSITSAGIFYVTDSATNEVYKVDSLGNVLKDAGGYGWDNGLFDDPSDVFANVLSVFVCDKNNHRVERFDKDLNYISQLYTRENDDKNMRFGYPLGCAVSQQGDLYILDSENKRVIKFDLFGNYIQNFGGYDAGKFSLSNPAKLALSMNNNVYVIDKNKIITFDQYGNGLNIISMPQSLSGIQIVFNNLTVNSDTTIYFSNLGSSELNLAKLTLSGNDELKEIISSLIFNNKLYVLTSTKILVYQKMQ